MNNRNEQENCTENRIEKIGSVTMDLTFYPGEDYYCDGEAEDELLDIVKHHGKEEYSRIIEERNEWEFLYHLSPLRANIIEWLPVKEGAKGLEVGSGCGAITGTLAEKCETLTCVDLSKKRSLINAYRNQERDNITIQVGNFKDIEPSLDRDYDYIFLIGVFEYAKGYIGGDHPYTEFLDTIRKHLAPDGKIVIAIENKYGLKYFAGCREDHQGIYFSGIEDYPDGGIVRTFGRNRLEKLCQECGIKEYSFYYPYPDYKFMTTLYSDKRLPQVGELTTNLRNMDRSRMLLFDEKNAFDGIIREELFPTFSNSYLLLIGKEEPVIYSKYSNDRAEEYAIRTDIVRGDAGQYQVKKHALSEPARKHLENIVHAKAMLEERFAGSGLVICPCSMQENGTLCFPLLKGETLENRLDHCLERQDQEEFYRLLKEYLAFVRYRAEIQVIDYDLIFSNILIDRDQWQVIDYEWTYARFTPPDQIAYRALLCYCMGNGIRSELKPEQIAQKLGLEGIMPDLQEEEELEFQMKVTGEHLSLSQMRDAIHHEVLPIRDAVEIYQNQQRAELVQIYWDYGIGFTEELSDWKKPESLGEEEQVLLQVVIEVPEDVRQLRFDPAQYACIVTLLSVECGDSSYPWKKLVHNGIEIAPQVYLFRDEDPNFTIDCKYMDNTSNLVFTYHITKLDADTVERFHGKWKWRQP